MVDHPHQQEITGLESRPLEANAHMTPTNNTPGGLRGTGLMKKWWACMTDIMEVNPDDSPVPVP